MTSRYDKEIEKAVHLSAALEGNDLDRAMKNKKVIKDIKKDKRKQYGR